MENQRLLLAALLSAIILVVWNYFFLPPPVSEPDPVPFDGVESVEESSRPGFVESVPEDELGPREADGQAEGRAPAETGRSIALDFVGDQVGADTEIFTDLENEKVIARFSNRGAQLISFQLKAHINREGQRLELVRQRGRDPYPMALLAGDEPHPLNEVLFAVRQESPDVLIFRFRGPAGEAEKRFRLTEGGLLETEIKVADPRTWGLLVGPGVRNNKGLNGDSRWLQRQASYRRGDQAETIEPKKQSEEIILPAERLDWVALEDNFFLAALMPERGWREVWIDPVLQLPSVSDTESRFVPLTEDHDETWIPEQQLVVVADGGELAFSAFFGAKEYDFLASLPHGLEETVRWGWFGFLARPLYHGLKWIYDNVVANYGWAIVLITLLIKLIFFPLTHKSQESMGKMQALNPKVQAIRNKYRPKLKDKQGRPNMEAQRQMNEEMMALYKSAGVNPASGCLPILLQMPVFFAFYRLLSTAVELRNAPWIGWIQDLATPDPLYILPIAMGVSGIAMQKMMPSSPDPMQRRMMQLMPIMFMFFAFAFPSGLVLYWLTNNLLTMAQQAVLLKRKEKTA